MQSTGLNRSADRLAIGKIEIANLDLLVRIPRGKRIWQTTMCVHTALQSFFYIYFGLLGLPLHPFGSFWCALGLPWGALGLLWDPLGPPWDALGLIWGALGLPRNALGFL